MATVHLIEMKIIKKGLAQKGLTQTWLTLQLGKSFAIFYIYVRNPIQPLIEGLYEVASITKVNSGEVIKFNNKLTQSYGRYQRNN